MPEDERAGTKAVAPGKLITLNPASITPLAIT